MAERDAGASGALPRSAARGADLTLSSTSVISGGVGDGKLVAHFITVANIEARILREGARR
jgi:hypothetical protein